MKKITKLLAALLAMAFIGDAVAQSSPVVVKLTGSTAYRNQIHAAIAHLFGAGGTGTVVTPPLTGGAEFGHSGASFLGSSYSIFRGTLNGQDVIIKAAWSGSTGGIQSVSNSLLVGFLPDNATTSAAGTASLSTGSLVQEVPDISIADTFQSTTPFTANLLDESPNSPVGIIPFVWVAGRGAPAGLSNITPQLAKALFGNGSLPLALFTNNPADQTQSVFAIGRDPDSGTRAVSFSESTIGANSSVTQYQPLPAPVLNGTTTSQQPWPAGTTSTGIQLDAGQGGYTSGGTLSVALTTDTTALNGVYVSYVSAVGSDLATVTGNGGKILSYNGETLTLGTFDEIKNGSYSFWSYCKVFYRPTTPTTIKAVADAIAGRVRDVDANIKDDNTMTVSRQDDGGPITPKY